MSSELRDEVIETIVEVYLSNGNASMGAMSFKKFSSEDIDLMVNSDEIPTSPIAAGSKTYLAGMLYGANIALKLITDNEKEIDADEIVEANSHGIEDSLSQGLNQLKEKVLRRHIEESKK